jgi:hypothetical protein
VNRVGAAHVGGRGVPHGSGVGPLGRDGGVRVEHALVGAGHGVDGRGVEVVEPSLGHVGGGDGGGAEDETAVGNACIAGEARGGRGGGRERKRRGREGKEGRQWPGHTLGRWQHDCGRSTCLGAVTLRDAKTGIKNRYEPGM